MKITDVRTVMVAVPFARFGEFKPVTMWYMTRHASIHCITYVDTDEGITGVGTQGDQQTIMNLIRPQIIGKDPFDIEKIEDELGGPGLGGRWRLVSTDTLGAIDGALWDIIGKKCGQPLYKLWGGKYNAPIYVRYWLDCQSPEKQVEEARKAVARGWKAFKVKLGTDPKMDIARVKALREALGDDIELCFDINGGYPLNVAINTIKKMAKYNPAAIEDPVPCIWPYDAGSLDCMADIRRITGIPIEAHKKYYERKGQNRSTYEYLARWHFGQLYLKGGFIDAYVAWKLDAAVRAMEANGIYWITYGRPASGRTYYNNVKWGRNVMSTQPQIVRQNGLPSLEELGFETGGRIELFHFVSRFADSPAIWLWNCAEEDGTFNPEVLPYHEYIRSLDIYQHPHGVSEGRDSIKHGSDAVLLPDWYNGTFERCAATYAALTGIRAPVLDVEGSVNTSSDLTGIVERLDRITAGYHNHLWLCLFMKLAAGGTEWFCVELDSGNRLFHAKAIAQFLDGEHLTNTHWEIAAPGISDKQLRAFALRSERKTLAWVVKPPTKDPTPAVTGATLRIPVAAPGAYRLEFWDTAKGVVTGTRDVEAADTFAICELPEIAADLAIKAITRKNP
jgi:hypothetical protein